MEKWTFKFSVFPGAWQPWVFFFLQALGSKMAWLQHAALAVKRSAGVAPEVNYFTQVRKH